MNANLPSGDQAILLNACVATANAPPCHWQSRYLFIEAGRLGPQNPVGWKPRLTVLKHQSFAAPDRPCACFPS